MLNDAIEKIKEAQDPLTLDLGCNDIGDDGARLLAEAIKKARVPLTLGLGDNGIGKAGAGFLAEAIKEARVPLTLDVSCNSIRAAGAGFLAEAIKKAGAPLTLDFSNNNIGEAGAGLFAQAIKEAGVPLTLDFSNNNIGEAGAGLLAQAIKEARVPLTLNLSYNGIRDAGAGLFAQAIKEAGVPLTLNLSKNGIRDAGAWLFAQAIKEARIPLTLELMDNNIGYDAQASLCDAQEGNFIIDARSNPSDFLSLIEFSLSMRMLEQALGCPSVLAKIVQGYIGDDDDLAWREVGAIRAIEGASYENKYSSINYELLTAAYFTPLGVDVALGLVLDGEQMEYDEQEEGKVAPQSSSSSSSSRLRKRKRDSSHVTVAEQAVEEQYHNASSIGDCASSLSSSSPSSSSSYGPPPGGGGGVAQLDELDTRQVTAMSYLYQEPISYVQPLVVQVDKDDTSAEDLSMTLFVWIKDLSNELQQEMLSSFRIQQVLELLEADKFITDQLSNKSVEEVFINEYQKHYGKDDLADTSREYAQAGQSDYFYFSDEGVVISSDGTLIDPSSKPDIRFGTPYLFISLMN